MMIPGTRIIFDKHLIQYYTYRYMNALLTSFKRLNLRLYSSVSRVGHMVLPGIDSLQAGKYQRLLKILKVFWQSKNRAQQEMYKMCFIRREIAELSNPKTEHCTMKYSNDIFYINGNWPVRIQHTYYLKQVFNVN